MADAFNAPQQTIDWARESIRLGVEACAPYLQNDAFATVVEVDRETGDEVHKVILANPPTLAIKGYFSNAVTDLRHSFDQSLFAAAQICGCVKFDQNFPWADSIDGLTGIINKRQIKESSRLPQHIVDEILRHEPYAARPGAPGGNNFVRDVAKMANNKHSIGLTASVTISQAAFKNVVIEGPGSFLKPWDPVKKEIEISRLRPGGSVSYDNPRFTAHVSFEHAGLIGRMSAAGVALQFAEKAQAVLDGLKAASLRTV